MNRIATLIAATAVAFAPAAANAQIDNPEVLTTEVTIGDLNLTSAAGQATLEQRINGAVRKVCQVSMEVKSPRDRMLERQCVDKARGEAIVLASKHTSQTLAAK